jgi:hypothetical protein
MKILLLATVVFLALCSNALAQKVIISGKEGNRPLQWVDFTGKVDKSSSFFAYTRWKSNFKFSGMQPKGDSLVVTGFEMTLLLDPENSWAKKDKTTDELLVHEQGHFNIGLLYMKELLQKIPAMSFSKLHYQQEIQTVLNELSKKYSDMGIQYDAETEHSKNKEAQAKWNNFFTDNLS